MSAVSPAELASAVSLGVTGISVIGFGLAFADADLGYFDPRPAAYRATATARRAGAATHQQLVHTGHDLNRLLATILRAAGSVAHAVAEAWRDLAALVLLLTTTPKGALR